MTINASTNGRSHFSSITRKRRNAQWNTLHTLQSAHWATLHTLQSALRGRVHELGAPRAGRELPVPSTSTRAALVEDSRVGARGPSRLARSSTAGRRTLWKEAHTSIMEVKCLGSLAQLCLLCIAAGIRSPSGCTGQLSLARTEPGRREDSPGDGSWSAPHGIEDARIPEDCTGTAAGREGGDAGDRQQRAEDEGLHAVLADQAHAFLPGSDQGEAPGASSRTADDGVVSHLNAAIATVGSLESGAGRRVRDATIVNGAMGTSDAALPGEAEDTAEGGGSRHHGGVRKHEWIDGTMRHLSEKQARRLVASSVQYNNSCLQPLHELHALLITGDLILRRCAARRIRT